jgi:hypothetical protein
LIIAPFFSIPFVPYVIPFSDYFCSPLQIRVAGRLPPALATDGTPYDAATDFDRDSTPKFKGVPRGDLELVSVPSKHLLIPPPGGYGALPSHGIVSSSQQLHPPTSAFPDGIRRTPESHANHPKPSAHGSMVSIDSAAAAYVSNLYSVHGGPTQVTGAASSATGV